MLDETLPEEISFWLIARNEEKLRRLADGMQRGTRCFALDLKEEFSFAVIEDALRSDGATVQLLVNNAGEGMPGPFDEQSVACHRSVSYTHLYWATRRLNKHHLLAGNVAWLSVLILVCTVYPLTLFYKFTVARWIIAVMILIVATMFLIRLRKNKINFFRKGEKIQNV